MTQPDWQGRVAAVIAEQVKRYRRERDISAQDLADACMAAGLPMKRSVLANFENGRRQTVSVAELVVLAEVLQVPPIALIYPVGKLSDVEALPERPANTWDAAKWFMGERPYPDEPDNETKTAAVVGYRTSEGARNLMWFREHDQYRLDRDRAIGDAERALSAAHTENDAERSVQTMLADTSLRRVTDVERQWRNLRQTMRRNGVEPPPLRPWEAHIDEAGEADR